MVLRVEYNPARLRRPGCAELSGWIYWDFCLGVLVTALGRMGLFRKNTAGNDRGGTGIVPVGTGQPHIMRRLQV